MSVALAAVKLTFPANVGEEIIEKSFPDREQVRPEPHLIELKRPKFVVD